MWFYIVVGVVLALVALVVLVNSRPDTFQVSRSVEIEAPAEVIFPHVNNLKAWEAWSPFEKVDPGMSKSFEGAPQGEGAVMRWSGNAQAGAGCTTIVASQPPHEIRIDLQMFKPFDCRNDVVFGFQPTGGGTEVSWTMSGKLGFLPKIAHLVFNMDKMVGGQFQQGLAQLKQIAEAEAGALVQD